MRAMVLTVGTGTRPDSDIVSPLVKSIRRSNPDRVALLVTEGAGGSAPNGKAIAAQVESTRTRVTLHVVANPDDLEQTFLCALDLLRRLEGEGFSVNTIIADYTFGTKAMTAGLALAATSFGCDALSYVSGRREHGVVVGGTEKLITIPTTFFRAHHDLRLARHLFERLQFSAVLSILPESHVHCLGPIDGVMLRAMRALARAYDAWDKFDHAAFVERYKAAQVALEAEGADDVRRQYAIDRDVLDRIDELGKASKKQNAHPRERILAGHLADLWNNALRRAQAGLFDDAVARLYRLVELVAQFELAHEHDVNTSNVRLDRLGCTISDELRAELERQRKAKTGKIAIGLQTDYRLLRACGSQLGAVFESTSMSGLDALLERRNGSILAHGMTPVDEDVARRLLDEAARLARVVVPDFDELCRDLQFPWLRDAMSDSS